MNIIKPNIEAPEQVKLVGLILSRKRIHTYEETNTIALFNQQGQVVNYDSNSMLQYGSETNQYMTVKVLVKSPVQWPRQVIDLHYSHGNLVNKWDAMKPGREINILAQLITDNNLESHYKYTITNEELATQFDNTRE